MNRLLNIDEIMDMPKNLRIAFIKGLDTDQVWALRDAAHMAASTADERHYALHELNRMDLEARTRYERLFHTCCHRLWGQGEFE